MLICRTCGTVPVAISEIDEDAFAVVNGNCLELDGPIEVSSTHTDFDGEAVEARLQRRRQTGSVA